MSRMIKCAATIAGPRLPTFFAVGLTSASAAPKATPKGQRTRLQFDFDRNTRLITRIWELSMKTVRKPNRPWVTAVSAVALILGIFIGPGALADDTAPMARNYWMSGEDPVTVKDKHRSGPADYLDLFRQDAPWPSSAAGLKGFKITTQLVLRGTDEQLKTVIAGLRERHIGM